ncbi:MAG TPA: adenylate/guanylate cyclase domain-containing protein, partial [Candidatus Acidoferrales bacterium]|nr:adenylate/guanylate cyclase domain-containing protein [Candidatus Acidoferrales bacterium]
MNPPLEHRALPAGEVTFLFTDIEGSTRLWERAPDAMRKGLARHDDILQDAVDRNAGAVFKTAGDSFFAVFERPQDALRAATEAQRALANESWPRGVRELRVRIGLHTGPAVLRRGDYFGPTVNRVARLAAAAHGGQILLSSTTASLVGNALDGAQLRDLGSHRLKDLGEPERIFAVVVPGLDSDVRPPASLDATPNN